jgi:hypothetical protein
MLEMHAPRATYLSYENILIQNDEEENQRHIDR